MTLREGVRLVSAASAKKVGHHYWRLVAYSKSTSVAVCVTVLLS